MHIGAVSTVLIDRPLKDAAQHLQALGVTSIEIGTGGYFPKTHCDPGALLADERALADFRQTLADGGLTISAFAIHGQPLHPNRAIADAYAHDFMNTCALAARLGVTRLTLLSGVPEAVPGDQEPNWILYPFPPRNLEILDWQWQQRLIPYWKRQARTADDHGVRLCFEMHAGEMVYNPETLLRLRHEVGTTIACNLDPSHLFWQGMDIAEVIRALGPDVILHVHAKDSAVDGYTARRNGVLDQKNFRLVDQRSWLFRTVGYGHDDGFWRGFVSALRMIGYDDVLSIEHEDPLIDPLEGFELAVGTLRRVLVTKPASRLWYE